jgi:hypothetical protein
MLDKLSFSALWGVNRGYWKQKDQLGGYYNSQDEKGSVDMENSAQIEDIL